MLKPKRKITKKEIKRDPLLETVYKGQQYIEDHGKQLTRVGGGILAVVLLVVIVQSSRSGAEAEADGILASALSHQNAGNNTSAIADLDQLIDQYPSTNSGAAALYYLARIQLSEGDYAEARTNIESFVSSGSSASLKAGAYQMLGEVEEVEKNYSAAARNFELASDYAVAEISARRNLMKAAALFLKSGNLEKTQSLLEGLEQPEESVDQLAGDLARLKAQVLIVKSRAEGS